MIKVGLIAILVSLPFLVWSQTVPDALLSLEKARSISNEEWKALRTKHQDDTLFLKGMRRYWKKTLASHPKVDWPEGVSGVQFSMIQWGAHNGHRLEMSVDIHGAGSAAPQAAELQAGSVQSKKEFRSEIFGVSKVIFEVPAGDESEVIQWKLKWANGAVVELSWPSPFGAEWHNQTDCAEFTIRGALNRRVVRSVLHPSGARPVWVAPDLQSPIPSVYRDGFELQTDCIEQINHENIAVVVISSSRSPLRH